MTFSSGLAHPYRWIFRWGGQQYCDQGF